MRILTIDTATHRATVAAVSEGRVVRACEHEGATQHAERLFGMITLALDGAGWIPSDLNLIAVGVGPGSFTGVRVGVAAAKGLGFSLGVPLVGVVSLEAMAYAARQLVGAASVACLLDAKKNELFASFYGENGQAVVPPTHIARSELSRWLAGLEASRPSDAPAEERWVVGEVVGDLILTDQEHLQGPGCDLPAPFAIAALARARWDSRPADDLDHLEPLYVRPPDARLPTQSTPWAPSA